MSRKLCLNLKDKQSINKLVFFLNIQTLVAPPPTPSQSCAAVCRSVPLGCLLDHERQTRIKASSRSGCGAKNRQRSREAEQKVETTGQHTFFSPRSKGRRSSPSSDDEAAGLVPTVALNQTCWFPASPCWCRRHTAVLDLPPSRSESGPLSERVWCLNWWVVAPKWVEELFGLVEDLEAIYLFIFIYFQQ